MLSNMKYNSKYKRYVSKNGLVFRVRNGILVPCKLSYNRYGYLQVSTPLRTLTVHRLVYETFFGEVAKGFDIDHINDIKDDNRIENLRVLSHRDNSQKLSTVIKRYESLIKKGRHIDRQRFLSQATCI